MKLLRIFGLGLLISLLGSLPMGSLNIMAWRIYNKSHLINAIVFSLGVALVEVIYVRISLVAMKWVVKNKKFFRALEWFTIFLFIGLAIMSFVTVAKEDDKLPYISDNLFIQFLKGALLCAINPVQIPFWFLWSTYLVSNKKLETRNDHYNFYCIGIGVGTLIGEGIYMFGGEWLVKTIGANPQQISYFVGGIFLVTALLQLYKVLGKKSKLESADVQEKLNDLPEQLN
jgi:threonine/homoserine/homoserine lactone efflux protein